MFILSINMALRIPLIFCHLSQAVIPKAKENKNDTKTNVKEQEFYLDRFHCSTRTVLPISSVFWLRAATIPLHSCETSSLPQCCHQGIATDIINSQLL